MVFKFKWKPCFNTNDFIKLSKDLSLLLFIFEEPLSLWNSQKHIKKGVSNQGAKVQSDLHKTMK